MNYREQKPQYLKEVTSDGILEFFEDEATTPEDLRWFQDIVTSEDYHLKQNPVSKYNWGKIKTAFVRKYFPEIAPEVRKSVTTEERLQNLFKNL